MSPTTAGSKLDHYFERIGYGYTGPRAPTLEALRALMPAHVGRIPFENIDVLLGRPIEIEPEALFDKLVRRKRGGYCFEQNGLFLEVLRELGFEATLLSARVRLRHPRDFTPARTHTFLRVRLDGEDWLADVGVGAASLTSPLRFDAVGAEEQPTLHEPRRLIEEDGRRFHQIKYRETWNDVYEFTGEEMPFIDRVVASWYTSTHPNSHFKDRFMVAKALPEGRRATILDREFTIREASGQAMTTTIESPALLLDLLRTQFEIDGLSHADGERLWATGYDREAERRPTAT